MTETCAKCGFTEEAHSRKDFFKKQKINMIFADKMGLQPCKKFQPETPAEDPIISGYKIKKKLIKEVMKPAQNHSPSSLQKKDKPSEPLVDYKTIKHSEGTFNLSEKIKQLDCEHYYCAYYLLKEDVKTFIKKLKEEVDRVSDIINYDIPIKDEIDKLAGDELSGAKG